MTNDPHIIRDSATRATLVYYHGDAAGICEVRATYTARYGMLGQVWDSPDGPMFLPLATAEGKLILTVGGDIAKLLQSTFRPRFGMALPIIES